MLFPNLATPHYDVLFPLFLLLIIFLSRDNISKVQYSSFALMFILLFCVNFGLAFRKGTLHYGRFTIIRPSMLKYEYGNNDVVKFLNEKKNEGHEEYLYLGRRNHQVITTILKERPESASGTSPIPNGNQYGLTEEIANRMGLIDVTNMNNDGKVIFGSTVYLQNLDTNEKIEYKLVGKDEADLKKKINFFSISNWKRTDRKK